MHVSLSILLYSILTHPLTDIMLIHAYSVGLTQRISHVYIPVDIPFVNPSRLLAAIALPALPTKLSPCKQDLLAS